MLPTVALTGGWKTVLEPPALRELEQAVLPLFLRRQRWFGGKGRRLESVRLTDWGDLPSEEAHIFLALLEMQFGTGQPELYFCPLGVTGGTAAERIASERKDWVMARMTGPAGEALLHDALADDATCTTLLLAVGAGLEFGTRSGQVRGIPTAAYVPLRGKREERLPIERGPATSSNTLLFYGRRLMLKVFRRLEPGINPDFEIGRFLTEQTAFDRIPRVAGCIEYHRPDSQPITLAILQERVENQNDGWHHVLEELSHYYRRTAHCPSAAEDRSLPELAEFDPPSSVREMIGDYLRSAATLGRRTAEMHQALAAAQHADFAPQPFASEHAQALRDSIRTQGESALSTLRANIERLPEKVASSASLLLETGPQALKRLKEEWPFDDGAARIRCHGDYHLGQVLCVEDDYIILDFEGEPVRSVEERRARQSPLKDVAGMLRSYHYAAYAGLFEFAQQDSHALSRLEPHAESWFQWVSAAFLRAYRSAARGANFLPGDSVQLVALLDAFMLDKALYELNYELNNRPDWVRIPLGGILTLLGISSHQPGAPATGIAPVVDAPG